MLKFIWDDTKRERNLKVHGYDFADAEHFDWDNADIGETYSSRTGRRRLAATGFFGDEIIRSSFRPSARRVTPSSA